MRRQVVSFVPVQAPPTNRSARTSVEEIAPPRAGLKTETGGSLHDVAIAERPPLRPATIVACGSVIRTLGHGTHNIAQCRSEAARTHTIVTPYSTMP